MSDHAISWDLHEDSATGYKTRRAVCTCGWLGQPGEPARTSGVSLGQSNEATRHLRLTSPHNITSVGHSGAFVRFECECGHHGEWFPASAPSLKRRLDSDRSAHIWQLKRMEADR